MVRVCSGDKEGGEKLDTETEEEGERQKGATVIIH